MKEYLKKTLSFPKTTLAFALVVLIISVALYGVYRAWSYAYAGQ